MNTFGEQARLRMRWSSRDRLPRTLLTLVFLVVSAILLVATCYGHTDVGLLTCALVGTIIITSSLVAGALAAIQQANARLAQATMHCAQAHADLEHQVAARTADLHATLEHMQAVMQSRSVVVFDAAHDLRNYTQNLRAQATFLEWSYADLQAGFDLAPGEDLPTLLTTLHRAIDYVSDFAACLHHAARMEHLQLPLSMQPCELSSLIGQLVAVSYALFAQQQIALVMTPPPYAVVVRVDPAALRRVLENMLGNALKFTAQQTDSAGSNGQVRVTWAIHEDGTQVQICITDTGIGIAPEDLTRLGARFTRVHQRPIAGSGVGLHFAMRVVAEMGGQLHITSAGLGYGTTVTLLLPLVEVLTTASLPMQEIVHPLHDPQKESNDCERPPQNSTSARALRSGAD